MLWFPKAKINIGLSVLNRRSDAYHAIETLLYPIPFHDMLEIISSSSASSEDEMSSSGLKLDIPFDENLVWKSLQLLRKHYDFPSVKIHLHKQIPFGAGLGGGSSDAASTLMGLNRLFDLKIHTQELKELALTIGSDCPFFINPFPQLARGRGELLTPFEWKHKALFLVLFIPEFRISTREAYRNIEISDEYTAIEEILQKPIELWRELLVNDFEKTVFRKFPLLAELKTQLYQAGAEYASLSGSGSAIYALFSEKPKLKIPGNFAAYEMFLG
jgi:4-diphosphocytidyl-2-C-methyl-D-erythritol kinase